MTSIELKKRPENPIILEGFPGFGLVGTIVTEYLIEHLKVEPIGRILLEDSQAMVAIHENKLIEPLGLFYSDKYNIVIMHAINATSGTEWKIADNLVQLSHQLHAKEILSIEGVGSSGDIDTSRTFYFTTDQTKEQHLNSLGLKPLQEGIIMGVTASLLLKVREVPISCFFAETHSKLPDSKAAASIITVLDKYLDLKVDPQPLLETAQKFEEKVRKIIKSGSNAAKVRDQKVMSYVG
jgi:uncharacterized protein